MTVRRKLILAYVVAGIALVVAIKVLAALAAIRLLYLVAAIAAAAGVLVVAIVVRCPHCHGRPFELRWLPLFYVPSNCARCDREFYD